MGTLRMVASGGSSIQGKPHPGETTPTQTVIDFYGGNDCCGSTPWSAPDTVPPTMEHVVTPELWGKLKIELEDASKENFFSECEVNTCNLCLCFVVCCMLANEEGRRSMAELCKDLTKYKLKQCGVLVEFIDWEKDGVKGDCIVFRHKAKPGTEEKKESHGETVDKLLDAPGAN